jgi:hypothetical protein
MSIVRALVNQIGREIGRDVYKNIKNSAAKSSSASRLTGNLSLLYDIEEFKPSKYKKVTGNNLQLLFNNIFQPIKVNYRCFYFDDVFIAFVDLLEKIEKTSDVFDFTNIYEYIDQIFPLMVERHISWVEDEILMKEGDITLEKANIRIYESKGFFGKFFHKKKPSISNSNIEKLEKEIDDLKNHINVMKNFNLL